MAILITNPIVNGFSGMLGKSLVFKNLRGKTILSTKPRPATAQSAQQRANRSKFREASMWAKATLLIDPEMKAYYQKKAKKMKLPNAYTAAIADYMRSARVQEISKREGTVTYLVYKKDFRLRKVDVSIGGSDGTLPETRTITANQLGECLIELTREDMSKALTLLVTSDTNKIDLIPLR